MVFFPYCANVFPVLFINVAQYVPQLFVFGFGIGQFGGLAFKLFDLLQLFFDLFSTREFVRCAADQSNQNVLDGRILAIEIFPGLYAVDRADWNIAFIGKGLI